MVERERDEEEATRAASSGPLLPEGVILGEDEQAEGEGDDEKGGGRQGDDGEGVKQEEEDNRGVVRDTDGHRGALPGVKVKPVVGASPPPTLPFLGLAHLLRVLVDALLQRHQEFYLLDPCKYSTLTEIVEKEVKDGTARKVDSCSRALLWLTRSIDFTIALLQRLGVGADQQSLAQHVEAAYSTTLKPWHGWISSAADKIAMKLVPETRIFTGFLVGIDQDSGALNHEIAKLAPLLLPFLDDIHAMMAKFRLDRLKST